DMIGFFATIQPVKINTEDKSFIEIVNEINQHSQLMINHQSFPYDEMIQEYANRDDLHDDSPFFDYMFLFQDTTIAKELFEGATLKVIKRHGKLSKNDL